MKASYFVVAATSMFVGAAAAILILPGLSRAPGKDDAIILGANLITTTTTTAFRFREPLRETELVTRTIPITCTASKRAKNV